MNAALGVMTVRELRKLHGAGHADHRRKAQLIGAVLAKGDAVLTAARLGRSVGVESLRAAAESLGVADRGMLKAELAAAVASWTVEAEGAV